MAKKTKYYKLELGNDMYLGIRIGCTWLYMEIFGEDCSPEILVSRQYNSIEPTNEFVGSYVRVFLEEVKFIYNKFNFNTMEIMRQVMDKVKK